MRAPPVALPTSPIGIATAAAAFIGAATGYPAALILFRHQLRERLPEAFVATTTALLCAVVVLRASRRSTPLRVVIDAVGSSLIMGGVNAGLAAGALGLGRPSGSVLGPFVVATLFGLVIAAPLSVAFAVANASLALGARRATLARSDQARDELFAWSGGAIVGAGLLRAMLHPDGWAVAVVAVGASITMTGLVRSRARRAFLRAVDRGQVPGLRIDLGDGREDPSLPCLLGHADRATFVLVREREPGRDYRSGEAERAIARLEPVWP